MKKVLISVILSLSVLIGMLSIMFVMPSSALSGVDFFSGSHYSYPEDVYYTIEDGVLTFEATAAGQEVALVAETPANLNDYPFIELTISSTGAFDLCFNDSNNNMWIGGASDFNYYFDTTSYEKLNAGTYDVKFNLRGVYTWDGSALPANAEICQVIFIAEEPGTITVTKCQITDGIIDVDLNSRGDVSDMIWDTSINLLDQVNYVDCPAPSADDPQSSVKVTKNDDGSVTFGNTNGQWPAAAYTFAEPIVVNASAALELDFTVSAGSQTTIYVFMGPSTPDSFGDGAYVWVANPDDILTTDLGSGNYKGIIFLEDTIKKTIGDLDAVDKCYDEDGNYVITGVKVFATTTTAAPENAVTVNKFNLLALNDVTPPPSTTTTTTGTQAIPTGLVCTLSETEVTITDYTGTATSLEIPSHIQGLPVTVIGKDALRNCDTLEEILLPDTIQAIEGGAFYGCDNLTLMDLPNSVTTLGENAFYSCKNLAHIRLGTGIRAIPSSAFYFCSSLASVELPATLTAVNTMAFQGCSALSEVFFGGSESQWNAVSIQPSGNTALNNATVYFDCAPVEMPAEIWGDLDGNGTTDLNDATRLFYYINGLL